MSATPPPLRLLALSLFLIVACRAATERPLVEPALLAAHAGSMVHLEVVRGEAQLGQAAGFFVGPHLLLTSHQLLAAMADQDPAVELRGRTSAGTVFPVERVQGAMPREDLLLLQVEAPGTPLALAPRDVLVQEGDEVFGLVTPSGDLPAAMSRGRVLDPLSLQSLRLGPRLNLTLDLDLGAGLAGSPVFETRGRVLGMLVSGGPGPAGPRAAATRAKVVRDLVAAAERSQPEPLQHYLAELLEVRTSPGQVVTPDESGRVVLSAAAALPHGKRVQFERKGLAYNIGYWTEAEDYLTWELELPQAGRYAVTLVSSCPDTTAHTPVTLAAAADQLAFEVPATGSFLTFGTSAPGWLNLPAGRSTVTLRPNAQPPLAVMDLDRFELQRVTE